jgi:hypothetical protein
MLRSKKSARSTSSTPSESMSRDSKGHLKRRAKLRLENRILDAYGVQTGARNLMMIQKK